MTLTAPPHSSQIDATVSVIDTASNTEVDTVAIGNGPFALGQFIGPLPLPVCDIEMSQASYAPGEQVTAQTWRLANPDSEAIAIEVAAWFEFSFPPSLLSVVNVGADGSVVMSPGFDVDLGPVSLFTAGPPLPAGTYQFNCRLVNPVTKEELSFDENTFELTP